MTSTTPAASADRENLVDFRYAQIMADAKRTERALAGNIDDCIWWLRKYGGPLGAGSTD
jgi:hypothetical protein